MVLPDCKPHYCGFFRPSSSSTPYKPMKSKSYLLVTFVILILGSYIGRSLYNNYLKSEKPPEVIVLKELDQPASIRGDVKVTIEKVASKKL